MATTATTTREAVQDLNKVRYGGVDFFSAFDDLKSRLQIAFAQDFNDFALSDLGIMLMDLVAFGIDSLNFYLDRRATDLYLTTARTRKTVSRLARQLGYKVRGAIPSSVDLTVALASAQPFAVTIPAGFKFQDSNGIVFETAQATTFAIGDDSNDSQIIPCYQGSTFSESFVSDGLSNQIFELTKVATDQFLSFGSTTVIVNGSTFTENEFLTFEDIDQYEVGYVDDPNTIRFGDGIAGNIPTKNATINVTYITTNGKAGLVPAGVITDVVNPLVVSSTTIDLIINNEESSVGGDDLETIDHIKSFAGRVFKSRNIAVTEPDYEALAGSYSDPLFGTVAVAKAISSKDSTSDIELQNQAAIINAAVEEIAPTVTTSVSNITTSMNDIDSLLEEIDTTISNVDDSIALVDSNLQSILEQERTNKNTAQESSLLASSLVTDVGTLLTTISGISVGASDSLTSSTKNTILELLTNINGNGNSIVSDSNAILSGATASVIAISTTRDIITSIQTNQTSIEDDLTSVADLLGEVTPATGIRNELEDILNTLTDQTTTVSNALASIVEHVDQFLAADCAANLVTVPILARDNAGFYAAPSIGLIRSLQAYLDERKEVTQTVQVTSGEQFLVPAVISLRIGVLPGFSESIISATAKAVVEGILRNREFGKSLYISDIICEIKELPGVSFDNTTIDGYLDGSDILTDKLDANGNLIISDTEVITKGTITINTETV